MKQSANQRYAIHTGTSAVHRRRAIRTEAGMLSEEVFVRGIRTLRMISPLLPENVGEIHDDDAGVHTLVAETSAVRALPRQWQDTAGVYVLLGPVHDDGTYAVSIRDARAGITDVTPDSPDWPYKYALLVRCTNGPALDDPQTTQMLRELLRIFRAAHCPTPDNPDPDHLMIPTGDFRALWEIPESLLYSMAALGYPTSPFKTRTGVNPDPTG